MSAIENAITVVLDTLALTAYGKVGKDAVKVTMVTLNGSPWFRRWDTGEILATLPTEFRTVTDVSAMLATTGKRHNLAALPWASIPVHKHKTSLEFAVIARRRGISDTLVAQCVANYAALNYEESNITRAA
jgi:hypothetical protein